MRHLGRGEVERVPWKCARQEELTRGSPTPPFLFASSKLSSDTVLYSYLKTHIRDQSECKF